VSHLIWLAAILAGAAAALGTWSGAPGDMEAGVCVLAAGPAGPAQLALYGLAAALLARTGAVAARAAVAARRAGPRGRALAAATLRQLPGGATASVVPSGQVAAWCGGLRCPQVVVTTGLLDVLSAAEQQAALAHEAAHIRLGHHVEAGGLDDPEVGEVLLVSSVGGSWPYGWNRSVVWCVTYVTCFSRLHTAGARPAGRPG